MPYPGVPDSKTKEMEKCVKSVMADGKKKDEAIAICKESIMDSGKRDLTLQEKSSIIRQQWNLLFVDSDYVTPWVRWVFDNYIVFEIDGAYYRAEYEWETSDVSDLVFVTDGVEQVEHSFSPVRSALQPHPIRSAGGNRYETYAVVFGSPDKRDLYRTYFDAETNYYLDWYTERPWLYNHAQRNKEWRSKMANEGAHRIGTWTDIGMDDVGVFVAGELDESNKYWEAVKTLQEESVLYPSSGTIDYIMRIAPDGHVEEWPIAEVSSTVQPGEFRTKPISKAAARAVEILEGNDDLKGGYVMSMPDALKRILGRRSAEEGEVEEVTAAAEEEEEEVEVEETEAPEEDGSPELVEEVRSLREDIQLVVEHVNATIRTLDERQKDVEDVILALSQGKEESVRSALADPDWRKNLYVPTRSAGLPQEEEMSEDETAAVRAANESPDEPGDVFAATRVA